jgi:hypothetical protein
MPAAWRIPLAHHPCRDVSQSTGEAVPSDLQVVDVRESADNVLIPSHDWRNTKINVTGLAIKTCPELPTRGEHGDHVAADNSVVCRDISEGPRQVTQRNIAEIIGN